MPSPLSELAVAEAARHGRALLKFISANDAGLTGSHQAGFYLPKRAWQLYTTHPPHRGVNYKQPVSIIWPDRVTESVVTWYGSGTRSEYRLTRFGRDFPHLTPDSVGNLLVLIPNSTGGMYAFVLDCEEDIEYVQSALGIEIFDTWGVFELGAPGYIETVEECVDRLFREFAGGLSEFPSGLAFTTATLDSLVACNPKFPTFSPDERLMVGSEAEYRLFKMAERLLCEPEISRLFQSVDDFLTTAATIMNRRKSRAGRALENHIDRLLIDEGIPHDCRPNIDGKPDIVIPAKTAYDDSGYPEEKLFVVGVKTTCKDRWRQVLNEGRRVQDKHIITTQRGITSAQLAEMTTSRVTLVVPEPIQEDYPPEWRPRLLTVRQFCDKIRSALV